MHASCFGYKPCLLHLIAIRWTCTINFRVLPCINAAWRHPSQTHHNECQCEFSRDPPFPNFQSHVFLQSLFWMPAKPLCLFYLQVHTKSSHSYCQPSNHPHALCAYRGTIRRQVRRRQEVLASTETLPLQQDRPQWNMCTMESRQPSTMLSPSCQFSCLKCSRGRPICTFFSRWDGFSKLTLLTWQRKQTYTNFWMVVHGFCRGAMMKTRLTSKIGSLCPRSL